MSKSLIKNAGFNVAYKLMDALFPLVSAAYLARVLLPAGIGEVSFAQTIASYFVLIASLGIPSYGVREIAKAKDQTALNKAFSELLILNAISTLFALLLYSMFLFSIKDDPSFIVHLVFALLVFLNFFNLDWLFSGKEEYVFIACRSMAIKIIMLGFIFMFVRSPSDTAVYALLLCFGVAGNYLLNLFKLKKIVSVTIRNIEIVKHVKPVLLLFSTGIIGILYSKIDITMLGMMSSQESVGFYSNGQSILNTVLQLLTATTAVFLPRLSTLFASNPKKITELIEKGLKVLLFTGIPLMIGLILVSYDGVVVLFGDSFSPSACVVVLLSPLLLIKGVGDLMCYQVLLAAGKEKFFLFTGVFALLANVVLNYFFIPLYYQNGAAVASVVSELIVNTPLFFLSLRYIKPKISVKFLLSTTLSAFLMVFPSVLLFNVVDNSLLRLPLIIFMSVFVYCIGVSLSKNEVFYYLLFSLKKKIKSLHK